MIALQIKSTKQIMNSLLAAEAFDSFLTEEITITTFNTFHIDGHIEKAFYTSEEIEEAGDCFPIFSSWHEIKPICFSLIKGKKTPVSFKFTLHASKQLIAKIAASSDTEVPAELIRALVLNIRYEQGNVTFITGTAFTTFVMDKSIDHLWDAYLKTFLTQLQIDFEEI